MIKDHGRLTLVGVTHRTRSLEARVLAILRRERPVRVLIEMSRASLAFRRGPGRIERRAIRALLARTDPGTPRAAEARELLAILALPPELRAARRYVRERRGPGGPRIVLADLSRAALPYLEELEAWAEEVEERLTLGIDPVPFPGGARSAPGAPPAADALAELAARDRFAARRIRRARERHPGAPLVHVCGHEHLAALGALLGDLRPRRVRLRAPLRVP
jgi:hypothetical protein